MLITGNRLSISDVIRVASEYEPVTLDTERLADVAATFDRVQRWGEARQPIYGVNTGFGELVHVIIPPECKTELQCNLLRSHAAGYGDHFPDESVRAIMLARLNCLMKGHSGTSPQAVVLLSEFLNRRIHPVIPQQGSLGASGDLAPLSHMALPLIGEGEVRFEGRIRQSADVLAENGLKPVSLGFKEALSLVNGTSAMTGVACIAIGKAYSLLRLALLASADFVQCLEGSTRAFDNSGHALKNHAGQVEIAGAIRQLLAGSGLTCEHADIMRAIQARTGASDAVADTELYIQNAYSLRCIPQILGPVLDSLKFCFSMVTEEVNSCNDNPLFFEEPEETFHGGNFHGQYMAMACDFLTISVAEIGVLAERQLNRLLDPHLNGRLPAFLANGEAGLFCGYEGGQYLATSIASENLDLAAPSSVKSIPSNGSNQDVVSMGLTSARKCIRVCENVGTILSVLVGACHQAKEFLDVKKFSPPIRQLHAQLSTIVEPYRDDVPLSKVISKVRDFTMSYAFQESVRFLVPLGSAGYANGNGNGNGNKSVAGGLLLAEIDASV